ncbi:MAG TPA: hypothetical protein DGH68_09905, partial [Bacteroidetes bacterium]|nr:hypothetical protein [Bacteroidota bacterium]
MHMKSLVRLLAICWLVCSGAREQALSQFVIETAGARPDSLQKSFRVDFAIPDAPAFTLLGSEPSNILRPTTVREFSVAFSDFVSNGSSLTIPRTFGVEFSPGLIISGPKLSLTDYRKLDWLYRLRVSAATQRNGNGNSSTDMALGVRTSVIDESDLRHDDAYVATAT